MQNYLTRYSVTSAVFVSGLDDAQFFFGYVLLTKLSFHIPFLFSTGVTNLFAIGGHFVSYR